MPARQARSLADDDFTLFDLPREFELSLPALHAKWTALQRLHHPDVHVVASDAQQRQAMQWTIRLNQAYQRLKSPLTRAKYLCELAGHAIGEESNTAMPAAFLMQQMEWREALDDAASRPELLALQAEVEGVQSKALTALHQALDLDHNYTLAVQGVRQLMFLDKLLAELDDILDRESQDN